MAEGDFSEFNCSVCGNIGTDPMSFSCEHIYCESCVTHCWNDEMEEYSCSRCTKTTEALASSESSNVDCDVCTGTKCKAVKTCLECLKSFCQDHLEQHESFFKDSKHKLMDPTGRLNEMTCPHHKKPLEIYCRTDQQCICYPCTIEGHKNHEIVTVEAERAEKQMRLREIQRNFQLRIVEREEELQEVRGAVDSHKCSAQTAVKGIERTCTQLIQSIKKIQSDVTRLIRDQEKAAVNQAERLLKQLEKEIFDLKKRDEELQKLLNKDDVIHFLQSFQSLSAAPESTISHNITDSPLLNFDDVKASFSQLKDKLDYLCKEEIENISGTVPHITFVRPNKPKARIEFLQYFSQFTLDPNTANNCLSLTDRNSVAKDTGAHQRYCDHPERFEYCPQVLCKEGVSERCYWEVVWIGNDGVFISMAYKTISRKSDEDESLFGHNNQSWGVYCHPSKQPPPSSFQQLSLTDSNKRVPNVNTRVPTELSQALVRQTSQTNLQSLYGNNSRTTDLPVSSSASRIGVYVDHSAGTLSFYSVSDTMTLIHRVQTTFTQPLYPGFTVYKGSAVKLVPFIKLVKT